MYRVVISRLTVRIALMMFALFVVFIVSLQSLSVREMISQVSTITIGTVLIVWGIFGVHFSFAPWRWLWLKWPVLSRVFYPDLNGLWAGKMHSNWPILERLRDAAQHDGGLDLRLMADEALLERDVVFEIKAHLFGCHIRAVFSGADDATMMNHSDTEFVLAKRNTKTKELSLSYLYTQNTPNGSATDERTHPGAAKLSFRLIDDEPCLFGDYWTDRRWRDGLNTAGQLKLRRVSDQHARRDEDLMTAVKRLVGALSEVTSQPSTTAEPQ